MGAKGFWVLAFLVMTALWSSPAAGDGLMFSITARCEEGAKETRLSAFCSDALSCMERYSTIYGCTDGCEEARLLVENLHWHEVECTCNCMMSGRSYPCDATPTCDGTDNDYGKCYVTAEATLPYGCEQLRYDSLCSQPWCPEGDPFREWFCAGNDCYAPCVSFSVGLEGVASCPGSRSGKGLGSAGCSTASVSVKNASLAVLVFFGLVLMLSLVWARRMRRPSS